MVLRQSGRTGAGHGRSGESLRADVRDSGLTAAAVTNAAVSLAGNIPGFEIIGCLGDLGFNGAEIYETLTDDSWCADNPVSCAAFVVSLDVCTAQSCFGGGEPYAYALEAVCTAAPLISATIERVGYYGLCVEYLASEIGMPINASQGCFCDRREFFDPGLFYSYQECVAERPAAQIGTAAANCRSGRQQTGWPLRVRVAWMLARITANLLPVRYLPVRDSR